VLIGKQVRLRAIEREDVPAFLRWFNDPEVRQYLLLYKPMSKAEEERWVEARQEARDEFIFGIEALIGEEWVLIGNVGLVKIDWKNRAAALGIVLGEKEHWGQGYGTEATRLMLRFAFHELNLHRVELDVFDFNERAMRCYKKVGFRREGTKRAALFHDGRYHDVHVMGILREEFLEDDTAAR
jgi:diamine N-acetyltransferase